MGSRLAAFGAVSSALLCPIGLSAQQSPSQLYEKFKRSVVQIETDRGSGTGFFIKRNDLVATAYHVIANAAFIRISRFGEKDKAAGGPSDEVDALINEWNGAHTVKAVYADPAADLAILQLNTTESAKHIPLGDHNSVKVGSQISVIGTPLGLESTLSVGIVSAKREKAGINLIQFSAPISAGSSGSPLIAPSGYAVGVVSGHFADGQALNFAVSSAALGTLLTEKPIPIDTFLKKGREGQQLSQELGRQHSIGLSWLLKTQAEALVDVEKGERVFASIITGIPHQRLQQSSLASKALELKVQSIVNQLTAAESDLSELMKRSLRLTTQELLDRLEYGEEEALARRNASELSINKGTLDLLFKADGLYGALHRAYGEGDWFSQSAFEDGMLSSGGPTAAAAFYLKPRITRNALPGDLNGCKIGWATSDSPFNSGDYITGAKVPGKSKESTLLFWSDLVKFIRGLDPNIRAVEVKVRRQANFGQEVWIPCLIER